MPACIIVPAHNEQDTVVNVIRAIKDTVDYPVILIDDASSDQTARLAKQSGAIVLRLPVQLGAWGAIQTGMRYAEKNGFNYAITMDADGQHQASDIPLLLNHIRNEQADICIGACPSRGSASRKFAWFLLKKISGLSMEDITSGFRSYNRKAMSIIASKEATLLEYQDIGVLTLLQYHRLKILEIRVDMRSRTSGYSRIFSSWFTVFYYMCHSILLGFSKRNRRISRPN